RTSGSGQFRHSRSQRLLVCSRDRANRMIDFPQGHLSSLLIGWTLLALGSSAKQRSPLLRSTAKVCLLNLCDLLIIERDRGATMPLLTDEVISRRWLMTT